MLKYNEEDVITQIRRQAGCLESRNYVMTLRLGSIEGTQLNLCKGNNIFCHVDCFCLQGKKKRIKPEVFSVSNTSATASATMTQPGCTKYGDISAVVRCSWLKFGAISS